MKFGMRKPSFKRSFKARTTGKIKRKLKKSLVPGYGKKGAGWIKNPKKALYNKVYNKTTFGVGDVTRAVSMTNPKNKMQKNATKGRESMETTVKTPFYKKVWFMVLISVLFPIVGIVLMWKFKKEWHKVIKIILTVIASIWMLLLLIICFAGESEPAENESETTTQILVEEETTTSVNKSETTTVINEESTSAVETTTEESTTKEITTKEVTTKAPTTKAPTTKAPTTKAPTTKAPTTKAPTTKAPTTKAPTTKAPTTKAPTTKAPTTKKADSGSNNSNVDYVINTNTGKFHYPSCSSVKEIKPYNREDFKGDRQTIINRGYTPCGRCHP